MCFFIGFGFGVVMFNCVMLVVEYMLEWCKGVMIILMYSGFNVGFGFGGFIVVGLLLYYSWYLVLVFGGVLLFVVFFFMIVMLLELVMNMVVC